MQEASAPQKLKLSELPTAISEMKEAMEKALASFEREFDSRNGDRFLAYRTGEISTASNSPISCAFYIGESKIFAKVTNVVDEDHIATLREEFKSVNHGNPMEIYIAKMQRALTSDKSQLGLACIRYEGQADLLLDIDSGSSPSRPALIFETRKG